MTSIADVVAERLGIAATDRPVVGVILGSGLGKIAERIVENGGRTVGYGGIPGMPATQVIGHQGRFVSGRVGDCSVVMMQGRVHHYEGHSAASVTLGLRVMVELGVRKLIVTNAAGGIRDGMRPGDLMLISGHLMFPIIGDLKLGGDKGPGRNGNLWNAALLDCGRQTSSDLRIHEGIYAMMSGPCYETPAEIRMLRTLGADAVGMSTVPEAVAAASSGVAVLGVSCLTNIAAGLSSGTLSHAEVTETASAVESRFADWMWRLIPAVADTDPRSG